jgi:hypothetical protein
MIWPKAQVPHHSLAQQILAVVLAWLALTAGLPTNTFSSPLPAISRVRFARSLAAALPPAQPVPLDPAPVPAPAPPDDSRETKKWGEITIAQPKIWQYERVNSLLDGLLRDVQGVSMSDLIGLDSNATNGAAVKFVQSMLEIGVQYNQGAATTNAITLQNYAASQGIASSQIQANGAYLQQLYSERTSVTGELLAAMQLNTTLQGQLAATDPTTAAYKSLTTQQQAAASQVTSLQSDLTSINSQITAASSTTIPAAPTLTPTTGGTAPETANTFSSFLGNLPPDLTKNIVSQLQSPSLPATKRLDNFITLLYERLAREISVLQDDVMRDTDNVPFLVQFDVGLYPSSQAKNHVGVVEFTMDCDGCKVYSIYPSQSSYNLANYEGTSKRYSLYGALQTLFGFGINANYRRQTDTLHGDLVQSVYMSGFQEGAESPDRTGQQRKQRFGWYYGASPFEQLVTSGMRTTFALVSVPRRLVKSCMGSGVGQPADNLPRSCLASEIERGCQLNPETSSKDDPPLCSLMQQTDKLGTTTVTLNMRAHADWAPRDNPESHWSSFSNEGVGSSQHGITRNLRVVLPGTDGINGIPDVVLAERNRLHVLGMEYNPVYYAPPPQTTTANTTPTPSAPGTASATASGGGTGATTVTVSGAGTASASSSGTISSTATATAANPPSTPSAASSTPATTDPLTGCKQDQCASVLVKLAEPLDPNLVVTVRGLPLRRVRDWRGRATSVLPPAQSASDLTSPATLSTGGSGAAPGKPIGAENAPSASLFEVDAPGPDTWMEVDSHRILINISRTLAGDHNDFPTIQIIDPAKRALFLPLELDTGFSELIMNGFHFPTRDGAQLSEYLDSHLSRKRLLEPEKSWDLHPAGPYTYETFLPLFLPRRDAQPIYAYLGETGTQILIGLEKIPPDPSKTAAPIRPKSWLAGKTQVVLEDRYLDLAWSLSCYPQSPMLVCDVPTQEIGDAYSIVNDICKGGKACPSIPNTLNNFLSISSLQVWVDQYDPDSDDSFYSSVPAGIGRFPVIPDDVTKTRPDVGYRPWHFESANPDWVKLTGCSYPEFPDKEDDKDKTSQAVTILGQGIPNKFKTQVLRPGLENGCKWFVIPTLALTNKEVVIEYPFRPVKTLVSTDSTEIPLSWPPTANLCVAAAKGGWPCTPESLPTSLFQPDFDSPIAIPHLIPDASPGKTSIIDKWTIDIPVRHVDCNDMLDFPTGTAGLSASWRIGAVPRFAVGASDAPSIPSCADQLLASIRAVARAAMTKAQADKNSAQIEEDKAGDDMVATAKAAKKIVDAGKAIDDAQGLAVKAEAAARVAPNWDEASKNGQLMLEFEINRAALVDLPLKNPVHVLRGPLLSRIATLPDLRSSFLPTKLSVVNVGTNQFALEGDNAGVIDAVTVLGPSSFDNPITVASGAQVALVTLPTPTAAPSASTKSTITISIDPSPIGAAVEIKGNNFGTELGSVVFSKNITAAVEKGCWANNSIKVNVPKGAEPGAVKITFKDPTTGKTTNKTVEKFTVAGTDLKEPETIKCVATGGANGQADESNPKAPSVKAGAYTVLPLIALSWDENGKVKQYMPLEVVDPNGKPLIFTAPEPKSDGTATPKGVDSPTTTLTISKKTTVTPASTPANGAGNQ